MKKSYIFAALAILIWSSMATVSKILLVSADPYQVLCISALFGSLAMLILNIFNGKLKLIKCYSFKDLAVMVSTGLLGNLFYNLFYYLGADLIPASQAFIINYLWPIMSVVFACILLKERLTSRKLIAIAISFVGVITVAGKDLLSFNGTTLLGAFFCALAAVFYGAFTAMNKRFKYDMHISMMLSLFVTFLLTLIYKLTTNGFAPIDIANLAGLAWNGIFTLAAGSTLWALALNNGNTAKISNLAYITPFLSLVWIFLFLKEPISLLSIAGLAVIVIGIFIQLKDNKAN